MSSRRGTQPLQGVASQHAVSWELPRAPVAPSLARRQLAGALPDLPTELVHVAQLLSSELVTNALNHGKGPITMSLVRDEDALTVRVADEGLQNPEIRAHDVTAQAGRGLQIVEHLATRWGTEATEGGSNGKAVWFSICTTTRAVSDP